MNKRGWMGKRSLYSLLCGAIFGAISLFSLANDLGKGPGFFPQQLYDINITKIGLVIVGLLVLYNSFKLSTGIKRLLSIIAGLVIAILGLLPFVIKLAFIKSMLAFNMDLVENVLVLHVVLLLYSLYLVANAFLLKYYS